MSDPQTHACASTDYLTIRLPMPPSVNAAYATRKGPGRGRVATAALRDWKAAAAQSAMVGLVGIAKRPVFAGRVDVAVRLPIPTNGRNRDGDNCLKATLDLLVQLGVIVDDNWRHVRRSSVEWVDDGSLGVECAVTVTPAAEACAEPPRFARTAAKRPSPVRGQRGDVSAVQEDDAAGETPLTSPTVEIAQNSRNAGAGVGVASQDAHAEVRKQTAATRQRRPSQRPSAKVASDTVVMRKLAAMGVKVEPGRVHVQGGRRG
jgi:Holliday junction resolvase RusA-like endonuclease